MEARRWRARFAESISFCGRVTAPALVGKSPKDRWHAGGGFPTSRGADSLPEQHRSLVHFLRLMETFTSLINLVGRLNAGAALVRLAAEVLPRLSSTGRMPPLDAVRLLAEIPALQRDIEVQLQAAKQSAEAVQDRVETLAQFLLLHRASLSEDEVNQVERLLMAVRG